MSLKKDFWITEAIQDLEFILISREYTVSAKSLERVRLQLIGEIYGIAEIAEVEASTECSNVVQLFRK